MKLNKLNKLKLNKQKTKYVVITFKKNVPVDLFKVKIGDNDLECVKYMKYLGVVIDDKLKFNQNMVMLQKKLAKKSTLSAKTAKLQSIKRLSYRTWTSAPRYYF
jgi:hypothetical protein